MSIDSRPVIDRIFEKTVKSDGCWNWTGGKSNFGHGRIRVSGSLHSPHRLVYEHYNGQLMPGMLVLHRCDNPACVRPSHLFAGSNSDNMQDAASRNRLPIQKDRSRVQGERRPTAKLNDEAVREIRRKPQSEIRNLAQKFGVHRAIIYKVMKRQRWAHVQD